MGTAENRELALIRDRIDALEKAIANGDKTVRYADGTYVEFNSADDLFQRLKFFQGKLAEANDSPRHTGYRLRVNSGIY